jgi:Bacterial EndoU nuclease
MTEREIARKTQIAWAINTKKDFCKVGKDIIPFDIVCDLSKASSYCTNVTANGQPVLAFGHVIPGMVGNAGSGIESGVSGLAGTVVLTNGSPTVTVGDKATVRNGDDCKMNCDAAGKSNVPGKIYTSTIQAQAARIEQNMWFSAREGLDGETDRRYGPNYDRGRHIADEWNSGKPLGEQIKRVAHAMNYTIPDEVIAARQAVVNEANAKWATIDAMRVSPMAALFYLGGTAAGAEPETLDKLAQTGLAVGGIVGAAAAARGGVNPIRPPMQGERPLIQQAVRLPEPTLRPGIRPPVPQPPPQVNGLVVKTAPPVDLVGFRSTHILNRHRNGAGQPGKTEYPASWSDQKIIDATNKIANDPNAAGGMGKYNSPFKTGVVDGIEIRVDFYPTNHPTYAGRVSTSYPINVAPNP